MKKKDDSFFFIPHPFFILSILFPHPVYPVNFPSC